MKKKRTYIIILVLFQLMVFVTPLFIKGTHIHTSAPFGKTHTQPGNFLTKTVAECPIYKFEFVTSDIQDQMLHSFFQQNSTVRTIELDHQIFKISFTSCLLRAPPVS